MEFYRCDLLLHDYLFFATTERGKVAETGPFVHNYALTYALGWSVSPWHNEIQKPHYREELADVGKRYITPASLLRGSYMVSQYNTMTESYSLGNKLQSIGYPDWGFIKCFRPGTVFRCYIVSAEVVRFPRYLRLGKFMAKTEIHATGAQQVFTYTEPGKGYEIRTKQPGVPLLTWNDLASTARPVIFDIIANALPGHLIANSVFDTVPGSYLVAHFAEKEESVQVPLRMGYYGENLCASW
jgi:CRISPR-associated protein Csc1